MLSIGIDWDDVISDLNARAIELANREYGFEPPLKLEEITTWENTGRASVIKQYYKSEELYKAQYVTDEAKKFMEKLRTKGEVYICTAVAPEFMGIRVRQIKEAFPDFPDENIIMGFQKSLVHFDVSLDDGAHNILNSNSRYPVLFRKPWNHEITGILSVNNYDDFLQLLEQIKRSMVEDNYIPEKPAIIALVGPSGSGKTELMYQLLESGNFKKPRSYSTNTECSTSHVFKPAYSFKAEDYLETTMYAGHAYGTKKADIDELMKENKYLVLPLDICGAITMKRLYPTLIVYCKCSKGTLIERILEKSISNEEKKLRLICLDKEICNANLCDCVIDTENENAAQVLMEKLSINY